MNEFEYQLKLEEMKQCVTNVSKIKFIKSISVKYNREVITVHNVNIITATYNTFSDSKPTGWVSLLTDLSRNADMLDISPDFNSQLHPLPLTPIAAIGPYTEFMWTPGIPLYLKLAVLKALVDLT